MSRPPKDKNFKRAYERLLVQYKYRLNELSEVVEQRKRMQEKLEENMKVQAQMAEHIQDLRQVLHLLCENGKKTKGGKV